MPLDEGDTFYPNERKVEGVTLGGEVMPSGPSLAEGVASG